MQKITLDPFLVKLKPCPFRETYTETWNEFTGKHDNPRKVVRRVGSLACAKCKYFDPSNFSNKERPKYINCNHE